MLVVSSPVPKVPDIYDPNFLPEFMVVIYMEKDYIFHLGHKVGGCEIRPPGSHIYLGGTSNNYCPCPCCVFRHNIAPSM